MENTYGVASRNGEYMEVSNTEKGAKNYATRNNYNKVYVRFYGSYNITPISYRVGKSWIKIVNLIR